MYYRNIILYFSFDSQVEYEIEILFYTIQTLNETISQNFFKTKMKFVQNERMNRMNLNFLTFRHFGGIHFEWIHWSYNLISVFENWVFLL